MSAEPKNHVYALTKSYRKESDSLSSAPINSLINFEYDSFDIIDHPINNTKQLFIFRLGIESAGTIELTYSDSSKKILQSGRRV